MQETESKRRIDVCMKEQRTQTLQASVRELVAFTHHGHDLLPGAGMARMREGSLAHRLRQSAAGEGLVEYAVSARIPTAFGTLVIAGRIDRWFFRGPVPVIEEIKLADAPPELPDEAHFAQAMCYGHMLAEENGYDTVVLRIFYARKDGSRVTSFERQRSRAQLQAEFYTLLVPFLAYMEEQAAYREERDASLRAMAFPHGAFREGQRTLAAHCYWAVRARRRLLAQAPTGIGKTAAVLFPALKALGRGLTEQVYYLTARGTARQIALETVRVLHEQGVLLRALTLTAKEKCCPYAGQGEGWRCDVLECPEAIGFFDRLAEALPNLLRSQDWSQEAVRAAARQYQLCPFELQLSLTEEADLVLCDYNYAFDPGVRLKRIFQARRPVTLLVDEAHNLPDRARDMLSAALDSAALRTARRDAGKRLGRKHPVYGALTALIRSLEALDPDEPRLYDLPAALTDALAEALDAALAAQAEAFLPSLSEASRALFAAQMAQERDPAQYAFLQARQGKHATLSWLCLDPAPHLAACTKPLRGCVFFSATLSPLPALRTVLGGDHEDGLLSLPSPYPPEHLLVLRRALSTRYQHRARTADAVAASLETFVRSRPGNYWACFPSYQYMNLVRQALVLRAPDLPLLVQSGRMDDAARAAFLECFQPEACLLGMVVLGGSFGESVDLPGDRLCGVAVVGVGLPQIGPEREALRAYYEDALGDGFAYAYRYPGMHKVLQAVGRVIRSETDRGVALLIDDRFLTEEHEALLPPHWGSAPLARSEAELSERLHAFWEEAILEPNEKTVDFLD